MFRQLSRDVGEAWSCEVESKGRNAVHKEWLGRRPNYLDLTDLYHSSDWEDDVFVIRDRVGAVQYQLDLGPFLTGK